MLYITRHAVKAKQLAPWIKFIWHFESKGIDINYKMLPTDCIDIVLNLSDNIFYNTGSYTISATPFHINGLRRKHSYICQKGNVNIFGISFYPYGLFPFIHKPLTAIQDKVVDLFELSMPLAMDLDLAVSNIGMTENTIENIEKALCSNLKLTDDYLNKSRLIRDYLESDINTTLKLFCLEHGVHTKTFMRNVLFYTGYTPKLLRSIKRFQTVGNQLASQNPLSNIAYDNDYADQSHFIRSFSKFSGVSPRTFLDKRNTVKQNTKYNYL